MTFSRFAFLLPLAFALSGCCKVFGNCKDDPILPDSLTCWSPPDGDALTCNGGPMDQEPNDTMPMATDLPDSSCDRQTVRGAVGGKDVDMFRVRGQLCATAQPTLTVQQGNVVACLFVQCATGSTGLPADAGTTMCSQGATTYRMPNGLLGCCASGVGAPVSVTMDCSTTQRDVNAYVVVDSTVAACTTYVLEYNL